jgi:Ca2+-binding EF-hand superfamily protein
VYKDFFPSGSAEGFCEHVFRTFDTDNSGFIDFKEFLLAINVTSSGTPEQKLEWAFRMYDIDGNGTIDEKEMIKIIEVPLCSCDGGVVRHGAVASHRTRIDSLFSVVRGARETGLGGKPEICRRLRFLAGRLN